MNYAMANYLPQLQESVSIYVLSGMGEAPSQNKYRNLIVYDSFMQLQSFCKETASNSNRHDIQLIKNSVRQAKQLFCSKPSYSCENWGAWVLDGALRNSNQDTELLPVRSQTSLTGASSERKDSDLVGQLVMLSDIPPELLKPAKALAEQLNAISCESKLVSYLPRVQLLYFRLAFAQGFDVLVSADAAVLSEDDPQLAFTVSRSGRRLMTNALRINDLLSSVKGMIKLLDGSVKSQSSVR